jgi:hypothetical protein
VQQILKNLLNNHMLIKELLSEGVGEGSLQIGVSHALPGMWALPGLTNQDPYLQYRMGLSLAKARAVDQGLIDGNVDPSAFGENMLVSTPTPEEEQTLKSALKLMGHHNAKRRISTAKSEENPSVNRVSPIKPQPAVKKRS